MKTGVLYLIPAPLGEGPVENVIPALNLSIIRDLSVFIAEEVRTARRFIRKACPDKSIDDLTFFVFNEHTSPEEIPGMIEPLMKGQHVGFLSEAGLPCVADPGSGIVRAAISNGIAVKPLSGPSSILLALMASGMNGQQFAFHGYLPVDKNLRAKKLRELEQTVFSTGQTQIFIEAPYRNLQMLDAIIQTCTSRLMVGIAADLTLETEKTEVKTVAEWKKFRPDIHKKPVVFLLGQ
jgi:16S rRNA (cytidine1402-2'-O)-methyltransferase